jgi:hypothetical protein
MQPLCTHCACIVLVQCTSWRLAGHHDAMHWRKIRLWETQQGLRLCWACVLPADCKVSSTGSFALLVTSTSLSVSDCPFENNISPGSSRNPLFAVIDPPGSHPKLTGLLAAAHLGPQSLCSGPNSSEQLGALTMTQFRLQTLTSLATQRQSSTSIAESTSF